MTKRLRIMLCILIMLLVALVSLLYINVTMLSGCITVDNNVATLMDASLPSLDEMISRYVNSNSDAVESADAGGVAVGRVCINDTNIDYELMYSSDPLYYTNHNASNASDNNGAIFLDYRIKDTQARVLLIHGLTTEEGIMFSQLHYYREHAWATEHAMLNVTIKGIKKTYKLFSVIVAESDEQVVTLNINSDYLAENFYNELTEKSLFQLEHEYKEEKQIIILNTVNQEGKHVLICFMEE